MYTSTEAASLVVLTASAVYVGGRAAPFPRSFYDSFPGFNRTWVGGDGPFNEHLVGNVVALGGTLVLAVLLLVSLARRTEVAR